jgi:signal recognition particle subunit SRP54
MLLARGATIQPNPWDNDELHIIEHRNAQAAYGLIPTMQEVSQAIELHIQAHSMNQQMKSQQLMQQMAVGGQQGGAGAFGPLLEQLAGAGGMNGGAGGPGGMAAQGEPPAQMAPGAPIQ